MNIPLLEDRLAANPRSPLFARLAACYLKEGETQKAIDLCTTGLKDHPDYATAHLVLGHGFAAAGRTVEALIEYRRVLQSFPDNKLIMDLVGKIERKEEESFRSFAEERLQELRNRKQPITLEKFSEEPARTAAPQRRREDEDEQEGSAQGQKIVTVTLAEIYASQGEFDEAIQVYRRLSTEKPEESEKYLNRVSELQHLLRLQEKQTNR